MESRHFWVVRFECVFSFVASNWTWSSAAWFVLYFYFFASKWLRGTSSSRFYDGSRNRLCKSTCIYLYIYIYFVSFCPHWNCRLWNVTWAITTQQNMRDYYFAVARTLNLFWSFARLPSFAFHACTWASRQSSCQMLRKQTRLAQCRLLWESFLSRTGTRADEGTNFDSCWKSHPTWYSIFFRRWSDTVTRRSCDCQSELKEMPIWIKRPGDRDVTQQETCR